MSSPEAGVPGARFVRWGGEAGVPGARFVRWGGKGRLSCYSSIGNPCRFSIAFHSSRKFTVAWCFFWFRM